jgi:hypothetical protein
MFARIHQFIAFLMRPELPWDLWNLAGRLVLLIVMAGLCVWTITGACRLFLTIVRDRDDTRLVRRSRRPSDINVPP